MDYRPLAGISAAAVLVLLGGFTARAEDDHGNGSRVCLEFTDLRMTLEQNATDGDTEVVLFAKGQDDGLKKLRIVRPDGRTVAELRGNRRTIGLREFALESAEPPELERVLRSVPAGWLEPGVKQQVVVGVRTPSGNITNVESAFFTAAE
ncbi:MAG: hypothetical protein M3495_17660 [Pseudomonadota bacterium]|nr:hypothetical protein [Gammaproteobacteria bacterium]MDQ3583315.1 hypothetical protein [Pseudomonadota bacterium]